MHQLEENVCLYLVKTSLMIFLSSFGLFLVWPTELQPKPFMYKKPPPFEGALFRNDLLTKGMKQYKGQLHGPESVVFRDGHLYTGTGDGQILDIYNGGISVLARLGGVTCEADYHESTCGRPLGIHAHPDRPEIYVADSSLGLYSVNTQTEADYHESTCGRPLGIHAHPDRPEIYVADSSLGLYSVNTQTEADYHESTCGRPLGIHAHPDRPEIYVADSSLGLYSVNTQTGKYEELLSSNVILNGHKSRFMNDITVTSDGLLYITDGSTKWGRQQFMMQGMELNPDGRLIEYDPSTKQARVVLENIYGNGIEAPPGEDYVIICETAFVRLLKCYVKGSLRGTCGVFVDNLPGYPDNIRLSSSGGYWVALTGVRDGNTSVPIWEKLAPYPYIRKLLHKWSIMKKTAWNFLGNWTSSQKRRKTHGMVIEINREGDIVRSLHDDTGSMVAFSHAEEHQGKLYLGSASNDYIGVIQL